MMRQGGIAATKGRGAGNRAAILVAIWTLIAVTLLSALAPLGPPLSRARGSAFNPATAEVVLRARAPARAQATPLVRPSDDRPPVVLIAIVAALILLGGATPSPVLPHRRRRVPLPMRVHGRSRQARAPPPAT
jgi:hypothetical protein